MTEIVYVFEASLQRNALVEGPTALKQHHLLPMFQEVYSDAKHVVYMVPDSDEIYVIKSRYMQPGYYNKDKFLRALNDFDMGCTCTPRDDIQCNVCQAYASRRDDGEDKP